ncbi:MAG: polyphosphate kinase 2 family protein [Planctomycetes bacterium]|nr:polyphosphate kinase 2 family protein [Planctomycetota bacterium]
MPSTHQLAPDKPFRLADVTTKGKRFHDDRDAAEEEFETLCDELIEWQRRLYADGKQKLLVVFQAMDAGGKDGTIRKVFRGVNPQGVRVTSFKKPSDKEMAHDYLWRVHKAVPASGMIGVFNRSHYEDVLVVRVENLLPEHEWRKRYEQINEFERFLSDTGTTILKFYLHISNDEQKERFQDRLDNPDKNWKFSVDDLRKRKQWDDYQAAYEEMLNRCTTDWAPWHVIPADQKWYRNLAIIRVLVETMRELDPRFPPPEDGIDGIVID